MKGVRQFSVIVTIGDPIAAVQDPDYLRKYIEHVYLHHCYAGCYIADILTVSDLDYLIDIGGVDAGKANATVTFTANVITYEIGSILNGVMVHTKSGKDLVCKRDHESLIIGINSNLMESISVGQLIPITVRVVKYRMSITKTVEQVALAGNLFIPKITLGLWEVTGAGGEVRKSIVKAHVVAIDAARAKIEELCVTENIAPKIKQTIIEVYSALANKPTTAADYPDAVDFVEAARTDDYSAFTGVVLKDWRTNQFVPIVYTKQVIDNKTIHGAAVDVNEAPRVALYDIIEQLLVDYKTLLENIHDMLMVYKDQDVFDKHDNLWKIYAYMKQQRAKLVA